MLELDGTLGIIQVVPFFLSQVGKLSLRDLCPKPHGSWMATMELDPKSYNFLQIFFMAASKINHAVLYIFCSKAKDMGGKKRGKSHGKPASAETPPGALLESPWKR